MVRPATADDLQGILSERSQELQNLLGLERAQFMIPVDGKGLRILVIVPVTETSSIPESLCLTMENSEIIEVRLEASPGYQDYRLFPGPCPPKSL